MENFISNIHIQNFKSIRDCEMSDCKRINLFIGRPNVGKSNIIEALSLFSIPYLKENYSKKLSNLMRLENETELFYNGDYDRVTSITTNLGQCKLEYDPKEFLRAFFDFNGETYAAKIDDKLMVSAMSTKTDFQTFVKRYNYKADVKYRKGHSRYLIPPFGINLLSIIENYTTLKNDVIDFFKDYNLQIAFDKSSQTIKILQQYKDGIFLIPYNSIADTLQRIIFYKAAITSNNNNVLLFEEPEAHSFPPYMSHFTQEMIYKKDNQYFIATHSPFILRDLLENSQNELAVFNVDYKEQQTRVRQLSRSELHEVQSNGVDLFFNNETYL